MCTLTAIKLPGDEPMLSVWMNRDEKKHREAALPPSIHRSEESLHCHSAIYPVDPQGGGTWLAANDQGLIAALINYYSQTSDDLPPVERSRGLLVKDIAHRFESISDVNNWLEAYAENDLVQYAAFRLVLLHPEANNAVQFRWNREQLSKESLTYPVVLSSSSFKETEIVPGRLDFYNAEWKEAFHQTDEIQSLITTQRSFHFSRQHTAPTSHNVMMDRPDAATVSVSSVLVDSSGVRFDYFDAPHSASSPSSQLILPLAAHASAPGSGIN